MNIRHVGMTYLLGVVADGALSMLAIAFPSLEEASDKLSILMFGLAAVVLVLALLGRLRPRAVFIVPVLLYGVFAGIGLVLGVALLVGGRGKDLPDNFGLQHITAVFPWFGPLNWAFLAILLTTGTLCVYKYAHALADSDSVLAHVKQDGPD